MKRPGEIGVIRDGALADLLLVDGDPLADIRVLQDKNRLLAVMKDGEFYREPPARQTGARTRWTAAAA
jgi:imidazolonepropionase-like amidohydrolase